MTSVISVNNLSRHFGSLETKVKAVDAVSFEIGRGEFTAIVGPSGGLAKRPCYTLSAAWIIPPLAR